jgi:hypothetical protein
MLRVCFFSLKTTGYIRYGTGLTRGGGLLGRCASRKAAPSLFDMLDMRLCFCRVYRSLRSLAGRGQVYIYISVVSAAQGPPGGPAAGSGSDS